MSHPNNNDRIRSLSERSGIEMIVIDESEKITQTEATRFVRRLNASSYLDDPIKSSIFQEVPRGRTVELPGVSFLVPETHIKDLVYQLNNKLSYRQCIAFISNDDYRNDSIQTLSIIHSSDKYNCLRLQETRGGSYEFETDSIIIKLQDFEKKYPFHFIGVGSDWLLIKTNSTPSDWLDFSTEVLKVCPVEDSFDINDYANGLKSSDGLVSMWWD